MKCGILDKCCIVQLPRDDNTATIDDYQIWGIGETEAEAWNDAMEYLQSFADEDGFSMEDFRCEPITARLFEKIQRTGQPGLYGRNIGGVWDIAPFDTE